MSIFAPQIGSFWNATGGYPSGVYTLDQCKDYCKTAGNVGFNMDSLGSCYCLSTTDITFTVTGSAFTSYLFTNQTATATKQNSIWKYAAITLAILWGVFAIKLVVFTKRVSPLSSWILK